MLHDAELGQFPYRQRLQDAIADIYARKNGLEVYMTPISGFIRCIERNSRYNCRRPKWNRFEQLEFTRAPHYSRSTEIGLRRGAIRERSRSRDDDQR